MKTVNQFILGVLSLLMMISCSKSSSTGGTPEPNNNGGGGATPGPLFLAVRSVIQANCAVTGCHTTPNPQNGINFSDDNTIVAQKDRIKLRAVDQAGTAQQMPQPPRPPLPAADQQKIVSWVNAGGKITN